tara:strand:- start:769 stop:1581 length:813 start_codon:yes stop_codon:yes gene_type:complete
MTLNNDRSNSLENQVALLKKEVDALQVESMSSKKPWYREVVTLVAFAALLFSFGTTAVSYYRTALQDIRASRIELGKLIKEITSIPEKHTKMLINFKEPLTIAELSAQLNNRNLVLAKQAASVIEKIENSTFGRGSVLDVEYTAVATALGNSMQFDKAKVYHEEAAKRSNNPALEAGTIRAQAGVALAKGNADQMRVLMQKAKEIFSDSRFQSAAKITKDVTNATTELLILSIPQDEMKKQLAGQLKELTSSLTNCNQSMAQPPLVNSPN